MRDVPFHLSWYDTQKHCPTQRAPEPRQSAPGLAWWESARFLADCVA